jgi:uncharacterized lipoprotein YmbA
MASRVAPLLGIALVVLAAAGCRTATSRFYTLDATAMADGSPPANYGVIVGPVTVPAFVDRPEFVVQVAPNQVQLDEFNRWAAPLGDSVERVVASDLATLLGTPRVATAPLANFAPAYRVTIDVQRFDSIPGKEAVVEAVWVVHGTAKDAKDATRSGRTVAREPVQGTGFDALAAAHSRALAQVSVDIAAAIRADAASGR